MDVNNTTPYPHLLFRTALEDDKIASAIIVRVTYDVNKGIATPAEKQEWPLSAGPWEGPYGPMEGDFVFKRGGVDLFVFGSARAPGKGSVTQMDVRIVLPGKIDHTLTVFGDRFWESGFRGLKISEPKPFTEMPVTLANAYGGWDEWDQLKFPYSNNPLGKGFIWEKENAVGRPLPNIEDPENLITKWNDRPHPAGCTSIPVCEKRFQEAIEFDKDGTIVKFDPLFYNAAFPELVAKQVLPGEEILVEGMSGNNIFKFKVPQHTISANLVFGDVSANRFLYIDQVGLEPGANRAFITYRYAFNYVMKPQTRRIINIYH